MSTMEKKAKKTKTRSMAEIIISAVEVNSSTTE